MLSRTSPSGTRRRRPARGSSGRLARSLQAPERQRRSLPDHGVALDVQPLMPLEPTGLVEDRGWDRGLADIVKVGAETGQLESPVIAQPPRSAFDALRDLAGHPVIRPRSWPRGAARSTSRSSMQHSCAGSSLAGVDAPIATAVPVRGVTPRGSASSAAEAPMENPSPSSPAAVHPASTGRAPDASVVGQDANSSPPSR